MVAKSGSITPSLPSGTKIIPEHSEYALLIVMVAILALIYWGKNADWVVFNMKKDCPPL